MVKVVVDRMKRDGIKNFAYIGFSDAWGDLVYNGAQKPAEADGLKVLTNERYARTDTSVTGQVLKMMATKPDAVLLGGSATQGALPPLALAERGYKGPLYGTPALLNADFVRVGGKAVEGVAGLGRAGDRRRAAARPALQQEDLDGLPRRLPEGQRHADDRRLLGLFVRRLADLPRCRQAGDGDGAKPGTPEFRTALKNAMFTTKDLVGTHAVYNFKPGESYGVDERSLVLVRLEGGQWKYEP